MYTGELSDADLAAVMGGGDGDTVEKKECTTTRKKLKDGRVIETTVCVVEPSDRSVRKAPSAAPVID